jgi:SAM-dependent methyltransferase
MQALWNGVSGNAWVESQQLLDDVFKPLEDLLVEAIAAGPAGRVLDVGCGSGGTTVTFARVKNVPEAIGIDISEPMIAAAKARAERETSSARFIQADAQTYAFEPDSFDAIVSRFGVMFFEDSVRAFGNLRRAARDHARLRLIVWRSAEDNPFMTTAEQAAATILPNIPPRDPNAPGQFRLGDSRLMRGILRESGWSEIDIQPIDVECTFPANALVGYFTRLGPLGRILPDVDEQTRARVIDLVRPAFDRYVLGDKVHFNAACWMVGASSTPSTA